MIAQLTSNRQLGTPGDKLQEIPLGLRRQLGHDLQQVANALAVEIVPVVRFDGIHERLERPVFFDPAEEHDQLIWRERSQRGVGEHLRESCAESIDLPRHTRTEREFDDSFDVFADVVDRDAHL